LLNIVGLVLLLPAVPLVCELLLLSLAAIFPARRLHRSAKSLKFAVIVPAHNEEILIVPCVKSLFSPAATLYVIAHNCTDATAANAEAAGAIVLTLNESSGHGKGAALHFGFTEAMNAGAEAVMVIDADSTASPNLVAEVAAAMAGGSQALQCRYIAANAQPTAKTRLQSLALLGMNVVRPRGRSRLGLSCGIFGNGFALSAPTLQRVPYRAHSIVEDLEYHLLLLQAGIRVDFLDTAQVTGEVPTNQTAAASQRARWEGGRLMMRRQWTGRLLRNVVAGQTRFLEPLLDLRSLPLATTAVCLLLALAAPWSRILAEVGLGTLALYVVVAACLGQEPLKNLAALVTAPFYVLFKITLIPRTRAAAKKDAAWVRTGRNNQQP
jgi:hypothetical protein